MIGKYQIVSLLGRGGMAEVFKAYQANLDRYVALKLMHNFLAEDPDFFERFAREAKNVAALRHHHIIQIHDFDREGANSYMVMEYVEGGTLKERLENLKKAGQRMPLNESLRIIKEVGAALSYAHKRNMIHRDIKPANVMIDSNGRAILTDFGIAKVISTGKFTASGSILGTPAYMSPEQGLGQPGDHRADIYSLGVLLYQLVTGRLPFDADTPVAVILKHVNEKLPPPRAINPTLPVGLENVIIKSLAKDQNQRFQTVDDMLATLENLDSAQNIALPKDSTIRRPTPDSVQATHPAFDQTLPPGPLKVTDTPAGLGQAATQIIAPVEKPKHRNWLPLILGGLAFIIVIGVIGALALGGILALQQKTPTAIAAVTDTPRPTETSGVIGTATTDPVLLAFTQQAGTSAAQEATFAAQQATIAALQATDTPTPTPDFTATALACAPQVTITKQEPKDGSNIAVNKETKLTLTLENKAACAWDDQTTFNFVSGDSFHLSSNATVSVPATEPGQTTTLTLILKPTATGNFSATWQFKLGDGRDSGQPIILNYRSVTFATPTPTQPPPPTATPTSAVVGGGPITGANPTFFSCAYVPNTTDYQCLTQIAVGGGTAPFTITVDGDASTTKTGITAQNPYFFQLRGRRCIQRLFSFQVVDAAGQVFVGNGAFDPFTAKLFNNNTEVCGLG